MLKSEAMERTQDQDVADPEPDVAAGSPDRFGYSWSVFNELTAEQAEQFDRWTAPLGAGAWVGARFLDVGCGAGRNSYWAMRKGAAGGVAIDVDERSLAAARRNLSGLPSVDVRFHSAYDVVEPDAFDIVFSIGVVHHLEDPDAAVKAMAAAAKPGGRVLVWVYGVENNEWIVRWFAPLRRALFSLLPVRFVHLLSHVPAAFLWLLLRGGWRRTSYLRMIRRFGYRHLRHIVFDQMIPRISRHYRRDEAQDLLARAGLADVTAHWINEVSWAVVGRKPG
jgi:SAM-dependent methyltransferase